MICFSVDLLHQVAGELKQWADNINTQIANVKKACEATIKNLDIEVKGAENQIKQGNAELQAATQAVETNNRNEVIFKKRIADLQASIKSWTSQISSLQASLSAAEDSEKSSIKSQISKLKSQISDAKSTIAELQEKITQIHENNAKLEHIKSDLRTYISKCTAHLGNLKTARYNVKDIFSYFSSSVAPYILNIANNKVLPAMNNALYAGQQAASAVSNIVDGSNYSSSKIDVDSASCFSSQASELSHNMDQIKSKISSCNDRTRRFTSSLKDRVSAEASNTVKGVGGDLRRTCDDYFDSLINRLNQAAAACSNYESIYLNVN